jgi:hypothetical protein
MFEQNIQSGPFLESLLDVCKPSRLFAPNRDAARLGGVLWWWESRRIHYNIVMLSAGLASAYVYWHLFDLYAPDPADDGFFPGLGCILFGLAANLAYCSGWIFEGLLMLIRRRGLANAGPILFGLFLAASLLLVSLPAVNGIRLIHEMHAAHAAKWIF